MNAPTKKSKAQVSSSGNLLIVGEWPNERRYERTLRKRARKRKGEWMDEDGVVWCPYGNLAGNPMWKFLLCVVKGVFRVVLYVAAWAVDILFFFLRAFFKILSFLA